MFQFLLKTSWILPKKVSSIPISQGKTVFTDGSSNGKAAIVSEVNQQVIQTNCISAQRAELVAVLTALREHHEPLNIVSDSAYVVHTVQNIETALLSYNLNPSQQFLFDQLQQIVRNRQHPFFITHIRAHTPLPGPLTRGNALADSLVANVLVTEATKFHSMTHTNAACLRFPITCKQAKHIVQTCPTCQILNAPQECPEGVNPRGLAPNEIWQMDVTHVPSFGKLSFVHVSIDTASGFITASAQTGETASQACRHLLICFSVMGLPKAIKTDNGPTYTSNKFTKFCEQWHINHTTGIPYKPKGQAIVERANCTLKKQLQKQKGGDKEPLQMQLAKATFTLNFLNFSGSSNSTEPHLGHTATERHFNNLHSAKSLEDVPIWWKDIQTNQWQFRDPVNMGTRICLYFSRCATTPFVGSQSLY